MGKNLHYSIPKHLEEALDNHGKVASWQRADNQLGAKHYIYQITRTSGLPEFTLHLSDEYQYTIDDYFQKPSEVAEKSFILVARPEATYDDAIVEMATQDKISLGKFGALMGALYIKDHWNYTPKERREEN